ncbi:DUF2946 family protein, partial [Pseudomonas sp. RIT-PI-AD]|uniref:DUF2946 family protein n=1 Tax=Pseudomonas sp. RIT-PI-AD TaxID=3035294 RepID=UPI0021DB723E
MLLLLAGPLLSQGLAQARAAERAAVPAWMERLDCSEHGAATESPAAPDEHGAPEAHWAKCGYCTLLFNSPVLTGALHAALPADDLTHARLRVPARDGHAASAIFPGARSRAPPARAARRP